MRGTLLTAPLQPPWLGARGPSEPVDRVREGGEDAWRRLFVGLKLRPTAREEILSEERVLQDERSEVSGGG